jgi:DNA-binding SARP family transcriptional activator
MMNLKLFGEVKIMVNSVDITSQLSKKGKGLLIFMASQPTKLFYREHLAEMFWHNYTRKSAFSNMRFTLWQTRKIIGNHFNEDLFINEGKHAIKINTKFIESDYCHFFKSYSNELYDNAVKYYSGDFLENFYIVDVPNFSDWVFNERESVQQKYFNAQFKRAQYLSNNNRVEEALNALTKLIEIDPLNETVYFYLMQYQYVSDNKVAAINTYRKLKQILRDELNISPSNEIETLYKTIIQEVIEVDKQSHFQLSKDGHIFNKSIELYISKYADKLNTYSRKLANYNNTNTQLVIDLCDTTGNRIPYEGMFEILDDLYEYGKYNIIKWRNEYEKIDSDIRNKKLNEDVLFFNMFETLITGELSEIMIIRIWNFHFLDIKTIEFMSYLLRRKLNKKITLYAIFDTNQKNSNAESFIKFCQSMKNVKVITD